MSYEKVRSIKITEDKVFVNCACNNVRPLTYSTEEYPYFSKILQEKGREAVEIALLKTYEGGSFQQGTNKFSKALKVLRYVFGEEYKKFNWRNHNAKWGTPEREEEEKASLPKVPGEEREMVHLHDELCRESLQRRRTLPWPVSFPYDIS